ncbi:MAG: hypothetical protein ACRDNS_19690 [Trebonia sp.]
MKRAIDVPPFGEVADPRERAKLLDNGLDDLARYWSGDFEPAPVQWPRIPVWVAGEFPHRRPLARALRWDGYFPTGLPSPDALAGVAAEIREARPAGAAFDIIVDLPVGEDAGPWERAGATWAVTDFGLEPTRSSVLEVINDGPN